jgi:hypothetical protein
MSGLHPGGCEYSVGDRVSTRVTKTVETENQKNWSDFMEQSFFLKKTNLCTIVKTGFDDIKTRYCSRFFLSLVSTPRLPPGWHSCSRGTFCKSDAKEQFKPSA